MLKCSCGEANARVSLSEAWCEGACDFGSAHTHCCEGHCEGTFDHGNAEVYSDILPTEALPW